MIESGRRGFVETGIIVSIPQGYYGQVVGRYSMLGIGVYTGSQTFDGSSTLKIFLDNKSSYDLPILVGDKIAELLILPLDPPLVDYQNLIENIDIEQLQQFEDQNN